MSELALSNICVMYYLIEYYVLYFVMHCVYFCLYIVIVLKCFALSMYMIVHYITGCTFKDVIYPGDNVNDIYVHPV